MKEYLASQLGHLKDVQHIKKLRGEASTRNFFRITRSRDSLVAMVYPEPNKTELDKISRLTVLYREQGLKVPEVKEIIGDRIMLQEDLGDVLAQTAFSRFPKDQRLDLLKGISRMVTILGHIPANHTAAVLDTARMKWEMDFFVSHFVPHFCPTISDAEEFRSRLHTMVDAIGPIDTFAHRDFHCRNMLYFNDDIYLVDFQDSLVGPKFYDLVSFAFDAYLDLKSSREYFLNLLKQEGMVIDEEQYWLTALQRNIKALGTFGFQVTVRKNKTYNKYINRTRRHILANPLLDNYLQRNVFEVNQL